MTTAYSIDLNIVKIKEILFEIAKEQATREYSGTEWLKYVYNEIEKINEKIIIK